MKTRKLLYLATWIFSCAGLFSSASSATDYLTTIKCLQKKASIIFGVDANSSSAREDGLVILRKIGRLAAKKDVREMLEKIVATRSDCFLTRKERVPDNRKTIEFSIRCESGNPRVWDV